MEPRKIVKSYDAVPRMTDHNGHPHDRSSTGRHSGVDCYGWWTMRMMKALRQMWGDANKAGDDDLAKQIEKAYRYLYTRKLKEKT